LLVVLGTVFATLFYVGDILSRLVSEGWAAFIAPPIHSVVFALFGDGVIGKIILWGPDAGIQAALSVGIPYVMVFYLMLAILEDSGYLNSVAFLTDRVMHKVGLHSRAVIPLVAGAGCSVPAIVGTRVLTTMRERMIASTLVVLIPCSARTAVIMGAVALFVGWQAALLVYGVVFLVIAVSGFGLNKLMPGEATGLVMEVFPFRMPSLKSVAKKTWFRLKEFLFVATPIMLVGSVVLGALYETDALWYLTGPLSPVVEGWLGLPAVAGLALVFAVLRKELALQLIVALAIVQFGQGADSLLSFMSPSQIVTYAIVNTLYIPCLATFSVLGRELGWRRTAVIAVFTVAVAVIAGGLVHHGLTLIGWSW
jgi:ferrous iron transport protein B